MKNWLNTPEVELGFELKWQEEEGFVKPNCKVRLNMLCFYS